MTHCHASGEHGGGILGELRAHAPFTLFGALTGVVLMAIVVGVGVPAGELKPVFTGLHVLHVALSAIVSTALYRRYEANLPLAVLVGLGGAIGVATLSDIVFPHHGAALILRVTGGETCGMHLHLAVIDHWYFVIPAALIGVGIGAAWPRTKLSHAGHVLLSTWASLFYVIAHSGADIDWLPRLPLVAIVLFVAVWIPCCVSDIVFPMLFVRKKQRSPQNGDGREDERSACG